MNLNSIERIRKVANRIASWANIFGVCMIFGLVGVLNTDVVARGAFNQPLKGSVELVIFAMVLIVFLQLPDVVRSNRLMRSEGFLVFMRKRNPAFETFASRLIDFTSAVFMGLIAWTVWPEFFDTFESCSFLVQPEFGPAPTGNLMQDLSVAFARCDYIGTPGIFTAPEWPLNLATGFGVSLCAIIFFLKAVLGSRELELVQIEKNQE